VARTATRTVDPLLKVPEVMAELRVGRNAVYDLMKSGRLRSLLVGSRRRVRRSALDAFIAAQEKAS
jgi:excisionase family DNA binding protein